MFHLIAGVESKMDHKVADKQHKNFSLLFQFWVGTSLTIIEIAVKGLRETLTKETKKTYQ